MSNMTPAWYVARTKPKHEHIAMANLARNLELEVFLPRLQFAKATRRGVREVIEPLFPGYLFVRCVLAEWITDIQHTGGVNRLIQFGDKIPTIADAVITGLRVHFKEHEVIAARDAILPGDEVTVAEGAFAGMNASVLQTFPPRRRIQILLDILGRPTKVEVDRQVVTSKRNTVANMVPCLAVV